MLYFIHLPVALSNKYTTHALDKLLEHAAIVNSEKVKMFLKCHQRKKPKQNKIKVIDYKISTNSVVLINYFVYCEACLFTSSLCIV